jgi:multidrug efflux pump
MRQDLASLSVRRPVVVTVFALAVIIFGFLGYQNLGVRKFPSVVPAVVTVQTNYPGASAQVIESQITEPLEAEMNSVEGIDTLESVSRQGRSTITAEFALGVDLDRAANDVRDRVSRARGDLPPDAEPPIIRKEDAGGDQVIGFQVSSDSLNVLQLTEIAKNRIQERMQTIRGVSTVQLWGSEEYAMRLWLNPQMLQYYGVTMGDVAEAVRQQNVELPAGRIDGNTMELNIKAPARLDTPEDFNELIVREEGDSLIRLRDVGYAAYGAIEDREILRGDGEPMTVAVLNPQPGANNIAIVDEARKRLEKIKPDLPEAVEVEVGFDSTDYIRKSIDEVQQTILLALAIVVAVIFLFLGDWRTTLVPVLVIPVSIIGAFAVMAMAGFSVNVLTLLALVLAMGLVVDDSIVVMENVYAKVEEGQDPKTAGIVGAREIFFAVVATTVALAVVFLPILFMGGLTGKLFTEFGITMAGTVIISSFAALTLAPMLCSKLLVKRETLPFPQNWVEPFFDWVRNVYRRELDAFLRTRWLAVPVIVASVAGIWGLYTALPSELAPQEDQGELRAFVTGPQGGNYEYMDAYMTRSIDLVQKEVPEREMLLSITSPAFGATASVNSGFHFLNLSDKTERDRSQNEIAGSLQKKLSSLTGARIYVSQPATIGGDFGGFPVQFVIQNLNGEKIREVLPEFLEAARESSMFTVVETNMKYDKPELQVDIQRDRARTLGVPVQRVAQTLETAMTKLRLGFFLKNNRQYDVIAQVPRENRDVPQDLQDLYVRSDSGELIPMSDLVTWREQAGPPQLFRFNRYNSATVSAQPAEGYTIGQGVAEMDRIADDLLDDTFTTSLKGQTREFAESSNELLFAFILALVFIYLVLSAQFESFRDSMTILLSVPLALVGALLSLWYFNQTLNVFSQIGMIMLIGLVTKNGILIVEFANQRRAEGLEVLESVREAAAVRFRPVLMTSVSTSLGILPVALALGAGAESRVPMGIAVVGGMVFGSLLTLFIVPAMYTFIATDEMAPEQKRAAKVKRESADDLVGEGDE